MKKTLKKYLQIRSELLKELEELFLQRMKTNKEMRNIQQTLSEWDKYLINENLTNIK